MAVELAAAYVSILPSTRGLGKGLARELGGPLTAAGRQAGDDASTAFGGRFTTGLKSAAKSAGVALGVAFGAAGTYGVKVAADFQQTRIAFEGILGSAEEADKRLTELQRFAAGTPFEFAGLAESAQQLLAVGFTADEIIPTMTKLGNVAATLGVGEAEIKGVVRALGQMRGKGKASAEELQQISEQIPGFSAIKVIAEDMGVTTAEAFKLMEKGAIPADAAIESILRGMESFPGAAGAMERQSKTLNGVLSTFKDTLNIALIEGIEPFLPAISGALAGALPTIEKFVSGTIGGVATVVSGLGAMTSAVSDFVSEVNQGDIGAGIAVEIGKLVGLAEDHPIVSALGTALSAVGDGARLAFEAMSGVVSFVTAEITAAVDAGREAWRLYAEEGIGPVAAAFDDVMAVAGDVNQALLEQKDILIPLSAAAVTFAGAFVLYTQVSRAITAVTTAASLLGPALASALAPLLASPIGLVVAAVAALAAGFVAAYLNIQPFRDAVDNLIGVIGAIAVQVGEFVSAFVDRAIPVLQEFADTVVRIARAIATGFTKGLRSLAGIIDRNLIKPLRPLGRFIDEEILPAFEAFGAFVSALFARISDVVGPAVTFLAAQLRFVAGVISDAVGPAFDIFAAGATAAFRVFREITETVVNVLAPALGLAFDALAAAIDIAFGVISGIFQVAFNTIEGFFDILTGILTGDFGKIWEGITEIIGAPIRAARDIVVNTFEEIVGFIGGVPARVGDFVTAIFGGAVDIATAIFTGIKDIVTETFEGLVEFVSGLPARISDAAAGMWDGIAEAFESVINFIINGWNSLEFEIPGFNPPGPGPSFSGFTLGVPDIDPVDFAKGGIVTARPGGLVSRIGEAGRDEAVIPLPNNFDIASLSTPSTGFRDLTIVGELGEDPVERAFREARRASMLVG